MKHFTKILGPKKLTTGCVLALTVVASVWTVGAAAAVNTSVVTENPAPAVDTEPGPVVTEEPAPAVDAEPGSEPTEAAEALGSFDDGAVATASSGTWQFIYRESCLDVFEGPCTSSFPQPQCPSNPAGKSCSPLYSLCYLTITSKRFELYRCM